MARHRWFRFSLRTLTFFVLIVCVVAAWIGNETRDVRTQYRTNSELQSLNVHLRTSLIPERERSFLRAWMELFDANCVRTVDAVSFSRPTPPAQVLPRLSAFPRLGDLSIEHAALTDTDLSHLSVFTALSRLTITDTKLSDAGLRRIGAVQTLKMLRLHNVQLPDDGLRHFAPLEQLEHLDLSGSPISAPDIRRLAQLPKLNWLDLAKSRLDADGLAALETLSSLEYVNLAGNPVSEADVLHLRRQLPNLATVR